MRASKATTVVIVAVGLLAGSAVGVVAQDEAGAMVFSAFYGSVVGETDSGIVIEMTDPRASGELSVVYPRDVGSRPLILEEGSRMDEAFYFVMWQPVSVRLVNEGGSWSGTGTNVATSWGGSGGGWLLTGEGGYEGLTMMLDDDSDRGDDFYGAIVPTDAIPPFPELPID